jgi:hypothetical protein
MAASQTHVTSPAGIHDRGEAMTPTALVRSAWLALLLLCLGCPRRTAIWIIPGSTASHLELGISDEVGSSNGIEFGGLRVNKCDAPGYGGTGASWVLSEYHVSAPYVNRVVYGQVPLGYRSDQGPTSLGPGCYEASLSGSRVRFTVTADGTVSQVSSQP